MRECEYCGEEFEPASVSSRHCSDVCWYDDLDEQYEDDLDDDWEDNEGS